MRVAGFIVVLCSCIAACLSLETLDTDELYLKAKRSVEEATEWFEQVQRNNMLKGLQSSKRRATKITPESEKFDTAHNVAEKAMEILTSRHNVSERAASRHVRQIAGGNCPNPAVNCNFNSKYRTIDGSCNNQRIPTWGMAGTAQGRLAPPVYADNVNAPRGGFSSRLPNARYLRAQLHPEIGVNFEFTNMVPQFGQFLDHDISITPEAAKQCCAGEQDANCWPINIKSDDYFFRSAPRPQSSCMDFTRSTPCFDSNRVRQQLNMNTAFIDGSQIYGSGQQRANTLRTFNGGRLITNNEGLNGFLPTSTQLRTQQQGKFLAGDDRINEMPGLAVMHNVFLMEHNRLAGLIQRRRSDFSDEQIYQEARRLVGAQLQQVTYNEYLPAILGPNAISSYGLNLPNGYSTYDANANPTIVNEFSTAAYRFGHSLVSSLVALISNTNQNIGNYNIKDEYFQDRQLTQSSGQGYDWILRGLMLTPCQKFDPFVSTGLTDFLFATATRGGSDLVARNIQRGRDHGLPGWNTYRNLCGLPSVQVPNGAAPAETPSDQWSVLNRFGLDDLVGGRYQNGNDVDLFVGGLHEKPVPGGASGATFNCIKAVQFARLMYGDRYFFTHGGQAGSFSLNQLGELRRVTLGDIICRNSQQPSTPRNVFKPVSSSNPIDSCAGRTSMTNMAIFF